MATTITTRSLDVPDATLTYDARGPLPTADRTRPLLFVGQPMGGQPEAFAAKLRKVLAEVG